MATKLFLRETTVNGIGTFRDLITTAGATATTGVVNTAASGTQIQWTKTAGGAVLEWISGRVPAGGFTLSGTMTFNIWASENSAQANAGGRSRVFKRTSAGVETEIAGGPFNHGVEFGTSAAAKNWTGTPTSTTFSEDDRIVVRYYITNIGTMGSAKTCTINYDGPTASASGDSWFQINETVSFKSESQTLSGNITVSGTTGISESTSALANPSVSIGLTSDLASSGGLVQVGSVSLSGTSGIAGSPALKVNLSTSFGLTAAISAINNLVASGILTAAAVTSLVTASVLLASGSTNLSSVSALLTSVVNAISAAISSGVSGTFAAGGNVSVAGTISAASTASVTGSSKASIPASTSLNTTSGVMASTIAYVAGLITLSDTATIVSQSQLDSVADIAPSAVAAIASIANAIVNGSSDYTVSPVLNISAGLIAFGGVTMTGIPGLVTITDASGNVYSVSVALSSTADVAVETEGLLNGIVTLQGAASLSGAATAVLDVDTVLSSITALVLANGASVENGLVLVVSPVTSSNSTSDLSGAVAFATESGLLITFPSFIEVVFTGAATSALAANSHRAYGTDHSNHLTPTSLHVTFGTPTSEVNS